MKYISYSLFLIGLLAAQTAHSSESSDRYTSDKEINKIFRAPKKQLPQSNSDILIVGRKPKKMPEQKPMHFGDFKPIIVGKKTTMKY